MTTDQKSDSKTPSVTMPPTRPAGLELERHPHFEHDPKLPSHIERLRHHGRMLATPDLTAPVLHPTEFRPFTLIGKVHLSNNTSRYRFGLPDGRSLGVGVCQHVSLMAEIDGRRVMRTYTPISLNSDKGYFDLVVKTYPGGTMSKYLEQLPVGKTVLVRGPKGTFQYERGATPHLLMLAGGSGITPMYQAIKSSLLDTADDTVLRLVYANEEEDDILLRNELDFLASMSRGRFQVTYVLNKPTAFWRGARGFVQPEHIAAAAAGDPERKGKVLLCGPPGMVTALSKQLQGLGYPKPGRRAEDQVIIF